MSQKENQATKNTKLSLGHCNMEDPYLSLSAIAEKYKIDYFAMFDIPSGMQSFKDVMIFSNWPSGFLDRSVGFFPAMHTNIVTQVSKSFQPFFWSFNLKKGCTPKDFNFNEIFRETKMLDGLVIPVHQSGSKISAIVFGKLRRKLKSSEVSTLQSLTAELFNFHNMTKSMELKKSPLSEWDITILQFLVDGKTIDEISQIVGLSQFSIEAFISRMKTKLDSSTNIELIAQTLREGLVK